MAAAPAPAKMITLKSSDEQAFVIEETVVLQSKTLEYIIADNESEDYVFPLPNITGSILAKVIEYCRKRAEVETSDADKQIWDAEFVNVGNNIQLLFDLIKASNSLKINGLAYLHITRWGR
ncbi:SKP1-like protein 3 [Papaver somniferum]|uniref:SKP1-like protein 3 n=1 Tax=Papaver somniferum TaxID=3469 RepID=UPI000E6F77F9|nr:SKP1-like protein 3 [Papaver somniferum]